MAWNREFSKDEIKMAKKYIKKYSTALAIREMKIRTTLRFYLTQIRLAKNKTATDKKWW